MDGDSKSAGDETHNESRRHPPPDRRGAETPDFSLSLRREFGRIGSGSKSCRISLCYQADNVVIRTWPERRPQTRRFKEVLAKRHDGDAGAHRPSYRGRIYKF